MPLEAHIAYAIGSTTSVCHWKHRKWMPLEAHKTGQGANRVMRTAVHILPASSSLQEKQEEGLQWCLSFLLPLRATKSPSQCCHRSRQKQKHAPLLIAIWKITAKLFGGRASARVVVSARWECFCLVGFRLVLLWASVFLSFPLIRTLIFVSIGQHRLAYTNIASVGQCRLTYADLCQQRLPLLHF